MHHTVLAPPWHSAQRSNHQAPSTSGSTRPCRGTLCRHAVRQSSVVASGRARTADGLDVPKVGDGCDALSMPGCRSCGPGRGLGEHRGSFCAARRRGPALTRSWSTLVTGSSLRPRRFEHRAPRTHVLCPVARRCACAPNAALTRPRGSSAGRPPSTFSKGTLSYTWNSTQQACTKGRKGCCTFQFVAPSGGRPARGSLSFQRGARYTLWEFLQLPPSKERQSDPHIRLNISASKDCSAWSVASLRSGTESSRANSMSPCSDVRSGWRLALFVTHSVTKCYNCNTISRETFEACARPRMSRTQRAQARGHARVKIRISVALRHDK